MNKSAARFARVDVLMLDDWELSAVGDLQRQDLLEVMEASTTTHSTIIAASFPTKV